MGYRRKARECALQMLFQIDMTSDSPESVRGEYWKENPAADPITRYADRLVNGAAKHRPEIDRRLADVARNWRLDRMSGVDRNVLRMAVYELLHETDTPRKVVINEAIEVSKKFGSETSATFVNGVLDAVKNELEAVTPSSG